MTQRCKRLICWLFGHRWRLDSGLLEKGIAVQFCDRCEVMHGWVDSPRRVSRYIPVLGLD